MKLLRAIDARFYAPAPAERLATVRVLTGCFAVVYLLVRGHVLADFRVAPGAFRPVGVAAWLSAPLPPAAAFGIYLAALLAGVAFSLGLYFRWSGPAFAALLLWVTTYRNGWGMIFHTDNLLVVHLGVLAVSDSAAVLSLDFRRRGRRPSGCEQPVPADSPAAAELGSRRQELPVTYPAAEQSSRRVTYPDAEPRFGWPLRLISGVTAIAYALAAVAKLKVTGISWMDGEVLRNYIAYDAMRKSQIGSIHSPFGAWLVQFAWPFPLLSVFSMTLELAGPVCVLWRRSARVWAAGLYGFHLGVFASMAIAFPYPLSGIAFASIFEAERLWRLPWLRDLRRWL